MELEYGPSGLIVKAKKLQFGEVAAAINSVLTAYEMYYDMRKDRPR